MMNAEKRIQIYKYSSGELKPAQVDVVVEAPVSLTVNGEQWLTFMCTPVKLEALAVGFLFNEGFIKSRDDLASVRVCPTQDNVDVWLNHSVEKPKEWRRTSGCAGGVTGVKSEQPDTDTAVSVELGSCEPADQRLHYAHLKNGRLFTPEQVGQMIENLFAVQELYRKSGGVHTSAMGDGSRLLVTAEDIGRHNSLDKIAGQCLLEDIWPASRVILTTGRVSSEMLQKAMKLGAAVVISRTSPTSLSIDLADRMGITLIGYARRTQFNLYTHPERITHPAQPSSSVPAGTHLQIITDKNLNEAH